MTDFELTNEHRNVLEILQQTPGSRLREIHEELVETEKSRFIHSPEFGDGWNEERREVRKLNSELNNEGLTTNDYQQWYLTESGRDMLS